METTSRSLEHEQMVIKIMRMLPPEYRTELVNFARFLQFRTTQQYTEWLDVEEIGTEEDICTGEERWDQLLAQPKAKQVLRDMANAAREEYHAGKTTDIGVGGCRSSHELTRTIKE